MEWFVLAALLGVLLNGVPSQWKISVASSQVLAQTQSDRKAEAELKLCREDLGKNQPEAAIQSCQQAVTATVR
jgi:hypothetical protein